MSLVCGTRKWKKEGKFQTELEMKMSLKESKNSESTRDYSIKEDVFQFFESMI